MQNFPTPQAPKPSAGSSSGAKTYEMLWDCRFCGSKKLLGKTHRFCPNCGAQQDPSWRYFPSDSEKVAVEDHVYVGADRICPACRSLNSASAEYCGNCGSPLTRAAQAKQGAAREKAEGDSFETENLKEKQAAATAQAAAPAQRSSSGSSFKWIAVVAVVVLIIGGLIYAFTRTTNAAAYVTGFRWERTINVEALSPVPGKADCGAVPIGAYNVTQRYEQVGSRQVQDGEECRIAQIDQGDGTFREERRCEPKYRSEPVYGNVCYYLMNLWTYSRAARSEGDKTLNPTWPNPALRSGTCIGCERESGREEKYYLTFRGDGDRAFECPVDFQLWQDTSLEKAFNVEITSLTQSVKCDTLKPAG